MHKLWIVVCLLIFWQAFVLCPADKVKPVDLAHSCMSVKSSCDHYDDVPIILIHGLSSFKETWNGINEALSLETGKRVCIVDLRNHGESPWTDEVDTATMTDDVKYMMDKLNIPKAVIVGHSMGGKIAVHLAVNYPEKVDKVIVEDMRPNGLSHEGLQEVLLYLNLMKDIDTLIPQGVSEKEARKIFLKNFNDYLLKSNTSLSYDDPDMFPIRCKDGKCRWSTNTLIFKEIIKDLNNVWIETSGSYDGPALFIYGTASNFKVGEDEENIRKMFPNAKLVAVKGSGHMVHLLPEFKTEVVKFINEK